MHSSNNSQGLSKTSEEPGVNINWRWISSSHKSAQKQISTRRSLRLLSWPMSMLTSTMRKLAELRRLLYQRQWTTGVSQR